MSHCRRGEAAAVTGAVFTGTNPDTVAFEALRRSAQFEDFLIHCLLLVCHNP